MIREELEKRKAGLVLEGGSARGVFTAGALDFLLEEDFIFPYIVGVSAGACNAINYASKQQKRTFNCFAPENKEHQYKNSFPKALRQKSIYDMDKLFNTFAKETFPYDFETYQKNNIECEMVVTNVHTGEAEYLSEKEDVERLCRICRASASMPLASPEVEIDGKVYLDGGAADSIPLGRSLKTGHKKNVVILTRPYGYRKKFSGKIGRLYVPMLKQYPNLVKKMYYRAKYYNRQVEKIEQLEQEGKIFVIRPTVSCPKRTEVDRDKLERFYYHGYNTMAREFTKMKEFLNI